MRSHAIVVESWNAIMLASAHAEARKLFDGIAPVTEVTPEASNGRRAFMVAPDGSKEGWEESDRGDAARSAFKDYLRSQYHDDGSTSLRWAEVMFADDEGRAAVVEYDVAK